MSSWSVSYASYRSCALSFVDHVKLHERVDVMVLSQERNSTQLQLAATVVNLCLLRLSFFWTMRAEAIDTQVQIYEDGVCTCPTDRHEKDSR
jgi:hypothetical protein